MKRLVVNADDFGFTRDVNAGIVEAHTGGILTATTLMANGEAFNDAVRLSREHPSLDIGVHCVLIGGRSLLTGREYPATIKEFLSAMTFRRLDPYAELRPQVDKIRNAGIALSHMDSHKHTHLHPKVLDAVARLSEEFQIPWVRRPFDFPLSGAGMPLTKRLVGKTFSVVRPRFRNALERHGCRMTDHFAGFALTGRFRAAELTGLLESLPEGSTEFMCHPGHCTDELRQASTRLKESRQQELEALTAPEVRAMLPQHNITLTTYRELAPK
jgi:predicted glycoside hydrolase/deacetylase ChbG (UPF0249 family)